MNNNNLGFSQIQTHVLPRPIVVKPVAVQQITKEKPKLSNLERR
jgi:hypothetical protein